MNSIHPKLLHPQNPSLDLMASQDFQPTFQFHFTSLNHTLIQRHGLGLLLVIIIFSIILLIAFLYFYYHFISHYNHLSTTTTTTTSTNFSSAPPPPVAQPLGLDSTAINNLPIFFHRSPENFEHGSGIVRESECSICLGLFEEEEMIKVLPKCQHAYHSECVDKWLTNRSSCPLCRAPLRVDHQFPGEFAVPQL